MSEKQIFTESFRVLDHDGDWNRKLTAGAFLRMSQQISTDHCESLGMDPAFYERNHAVFLLARTALHFDRVPQVGEVLTLKTMPESARRAVYKRINLAFDENGDRVGMVDSRWILVDTETKRIMRSSPADFEKLPFEQQVPYELDTTIHAPEQLEECGSMRADYSRCDQNGHMNNTYYADAASDVIPAQLFKTGVVTDLVLRYHNELPAGQIARLSRAQDDTGRWYVCGNRDGKHCFEAILKIQ